MKRAPSPLEDLPDVRDGLTRAERLVLLTLHRLQAERGGRSVSTVELWGRLVEQLDVSPRRLQTILARLARRA